MQNPITNRRSFRLAEISTMTGLSLPNLRKKAKDGELKTRKIGRAVIVLSEDLEKFLQGESNARS